MKCPVCDDALPISADRCSFCGYNFRTGKAGVVEPPPPGAAAQSRAEGIKLVVVGAPLTLLACLLFVLPGSLKIIALFAVPAAGGVFAKGLTALAQAKRWDLKQKLADASRPNIGASSSTSGAPAAAPAIRHD
jgi:hypothetical protein